MGASITLTEGIVNPKAARLILLSLVTLAGCSRVSDRPNPTQAEVKSWIQKELAIGASKQDVFTFLHNHRINYTEVDSRIVGGMGSKKGVLTRSDIQIEFRFDSDGRLSSYDVKEIVTGP
jgi:hypothetical protein